MENIFLLLGILFTTPLPSTRHGADHIENIFSVVEYCCVSKQRVVHRKQSSYFCVFAGTCILSRCLAVGPYVIICTKIRKNLFTLKLSRKAGTHLSVYRACILVFVVVNASNISFRCGLNTHILLKSIQYS
jgi:hypothetical protein